jgi:uncharacterized protein (DUF1800 family)
MDNVAAHALVRFGLGRRGAEPLPSDPAAWLRQQLRAPDPVSLPNPPNTAAGLAALRADRDQKPPSGQSRSRALYRAEAMAELTNALITPAPFRERLVWFWTNHFTVSTRVGAVAPLAGAFVEEAIRPHVTGPFQDMLLAVMRHPAMLLYLNNAGSVGPDSPAGQRSHRGLNENLARECLELHTVSPASSYTQADVISFARILTGWSVDLRGQTPGFLFRPRAHEPGPQTLMGRRFPPGEAGGIAALQFLAAHPATQTHLAKKLAQHFIADQPPALVVDRIASVLRDTDGDLGAAAEALIGLDQAWQPGNKLRSPQDWVIAALRALDMTDTSQLEVNLVGILAGLGQPVWSAPQPNGWPDDAAGWAAPEAMMRRIDWAYCFSGRALGFGTPVDVAAVADTCLGPLLHPATLDAIRHAGSRRDALTLFLTAPEFQRR